MDDAIRAFKKYKQRAYAGAAAGQRPASRPLLYGMNAPPSDVADITDMHDTASRTVRRASILFTDAPANYLAAKRKHAHI